MADQSAVSVQSATIPATSVAAVFSVYHATRAAAAPAAVRAVRTGPAARGDEGTIQRHREALGAVDAQLAVEPGRYVVADASVLLTRVNTRKEAAGETVVGVDAGLSAMLRPSFFDAYHPVRTLARDARPVESVTVASGGLHRGEDFVEVVLGVAADFVAERVSDARERRRAEREVLGRLELLGVRVVGLRDELGVVGGQPAHAVVGGDERDDDLFGDEQGVARHFVGGAKRQRPRVDEVGRVTPDDEVLHHVFQRARLREHAQFRQVALVRSGDVDQFLDCVLRRVDDKQRLGGFVDDRPEDFGDFLVQ